MPNSIIKDYSALKNAIKDGTEKYLRAREAGRKPDKSYPFVGFFHSKKGLARARNTLECQKLIDIDDLSILALTIAIFKTSGTWLQTEIAYQLIAGEYVEYGKFGRELPLVRELLDPRDENTLASNAFILRNCYREETSKGFSGITIDKLATARGALNSAVYQEFSKQNKSGNVTYRQFDEKVRKFYKILEGEVEAKEIDLNLSRFVPSK